MAVEEEELAEIAEAPPIVPATVGAPVLEMLTEAEACFFAIMTDTSGLDAAEFLWSDEKNPDACWRAWPFQWCLAGETMVVTKDGHKPIRDLVGDVTLLTEASNGAQWVEAEVQSFGQQWLLEIELERFGLRRVIRCTADHRWFAGRGRSVAKRKYHEVKAVDLEPGMLLRSLYPNKPSNLVVAPYGVAHGLVWGDGTREKNNGCHLNLWGEKLECSKYLVGEGVELNRPDVSVPGRQWALLPARFKEPVRLDESASYLYGWLAGYFAADGSVAPDSTCQIGSTDRASVELARDVCLRLGITVGPVAEHDKPLESNPGGYGSEDAVWYVVTLRSSDLRPEFFLRSSHLARWRVREAKRSLPPRDWKVVSVTESDACEEVYCAIVPETHSFVLDGYILTGNSWWRCEDMQQVDQNGRATGKTESIKARACVHAFNMPNEEFAITGPEKIHVRPLTDKIESQLKAVRLFAEMLMHGREGTNAWPFLARFRNGARILSRIPQRSGRGFKGLHPVTLETDESQDLPEAGWVELRPTLKREVPGAVWRVHGVSRGIPDEFQKITQEDSGWTVHRFTALAKPTWNDAEREANIGLYGSVDDPDYRRNILGFHGDNTNAIFVISRLLGGSDSNEGSEYNTEEYYKTTLKYEQAQDIGNRQGIPPERYGEILVEMLDLPARHKQPPYSVFWAGMDVGIAKDPSAISICVEYVPSAAERRQNKDQGISCPPAGVTRLKLLARIELQRVPVPDQAQVLIAIVDFYRPRAFSIDRTGNGLGILQELQKQARISRLMRIDIDDLSGNQEQAGQALTVIKGYDFGGKIIVDIDEEKAADLPPGLTIQEIAEKAGIKKQVKEWATDQMRLLVDSGRLMLPFDENLLRQLSGQTWHYSQAQTDAYGNRAKKFSEGAFHAFDSLRMIVLGMTQQPIEQLLRLPPPPQTPVLDLFGSDDGDY